MSILGAPLHLKTQRITIKPPFYRRCRPRKHTPVTSPGSITHWLDQLRRGDGAPAQRLWERYFHRLMALARQKLRFAPHTMPADEEDVALSAFDSFFRGMDQGRFPQLADRDDLWRLLFVITERKAVRQSARERQIKCGAGKVHHASELDSASSVSPGLDRLAASEPTPEQAAMISEECGRLLAALGEETLRAVALAKLEGYTNREIAERLELSEPTIERKLRRIRNAWEKELAR
jgi:DNA-directed RNA polymerase specialized sigma24 family protein